MSCPKSDHWKNVDQNSGALTPGGNIPQPNSMWLSESTCKHHFPQLISWHFHLPFFFSTKYSVSGSFAFFICGFLSHFSGINPYSFHGQLNLWFPYIWKCHYSSLTPDWHLVSVLNSRLKIIFPQNFVILSLPGLCDTIFVFNPMWPGFPLSTFRVIS